MERDFKSVDSKDLNICETTSNAYWVRSIALVEAAADSSNYIRCSGKSHSFIWNEINFHTSSSSTWLQQQYTAYGFILFRNSQDPKLGQPSGYHGITSSLRETCHGRCKIFTGHMAKLSELHQMSCRSSALQLNVIFMHIAGPSTSKRTKAFIQRDILRLMVS